MSCHHGIESRCLECYKEILQWQNQNCEFGVFSWNEDVRHYVRENAIKVYKSRSAAERYADKHDYVVRTVSKL